MKHDEAYDLIEPYVFGTLESQETTGVEAHLDSGCEVCLDRLREVGELSARLATAVPQEQPSPRLMQGVLDRIHSERPAADPRRGRVPFAWVTAMAGAAIAVVLVVWMVGTSRELGALREELAGSQMQMSRMQSTMSTYHDAAALLGNPCTRMASLAGVDPNPQAFGQVLVHPEQPYGVAYVYRMPQVPEGMEYRLWVVRDGEPTSVGAFTVLEDGSAVLRMEPLPDPASIEEFTVTIEPDGDGAKPTGMMYLTGPNPLGTPQ